MKARKVFLREKYTDLAFSCIELLNRFLFSMLTFLKKGYYFTTLYPTRGSFQTKFGLKLISCLHKTL